jgi:DNA-directed RNA polymerase subunit K/omega
MPKEKDDDIDIDSDVEETEEVIKEIDEEAEEAEEGEEAEEENEEVEEAEDDKETDDNVQSEKVSEIDDEHIDNIKEIKEPINIKELIGDDRITKPHMTIYEYVRILEERAQQLISGSSSLLKDITLETYTAKEIAELELKYKALSFMTIKRPLPNGYYELWRTDELEIL